MSKLLANTLKVLVSELNDLKSQVGGGQYVERQLKEEVEKFRKLYNQAEANTTRWRKEAESAQASEKAALELLLQKEAKLKGLTELFSKCAINPKVRKMIRKILK